MTSTLSNISATFYSLIQNYADDSVSLPWTLYLTLMTVITSDRFDCILFSDENDIEYQMQQMPLLNRSLP